MGNRKEFNTWIDLQNGNQIIQQQTAESQNRIILKHLLSGQAITAKDAVNRYGIYRLSARIYDLRNGKGGIKPVPIQSRLIIDGAKHYSIYRIVQ